MSADAIPAELRDLPRWCVWRWEPDPDKPDKPRKPPYQATAPDRHASSTKPETWAPFEQALAIVETGEADGLGFALDPPYVGVDLDPELPETDQGAVMLTLNSYSERSPSGTGYHVVVRASLNGTGRHPRGIGVFQRERFFYFTGEHVRGTPATIEERQVELERVLAEYLPARAPNAAATTLVQPVNLGDEELLEKALASDPTFAALWRGDTSAQPSPSEADLSLCGKLAWWTGRDPARVDRMFRASGLMRAKWDEDRGESTYGANTIVRAIKGTRTIYEPPPAPVIPKSESLRNYSPEQELAAATAEGEADPTQDEPFALPIRDFIARPREQREALLVDADGRAVIGRRSLTLLGALGGQGKTTKFIDLALHMAAGVDYPPWTVPAPVSILIIENEGPEELFADKLETRLATFPHELKARLDVHILDWGGFSLADDGLRDRLTREIADKGYDLIFGDPLDSLGIEGVGSPEDTRNFMKLMKATGLTKTVAWWLNTHPRKDKTKDALNEIAGAWGGKPDTVFLLRLLEGDRSLLRQPKLRWTKRGKGPNLIFDFDPETEAFSYVGVEEREQREQRDLVSELAVLMADGTWWTMSKLRKPKDKGGVGADPESIRSALQDAQFECVTGDLIGSRKDWTYYRLHRREGRDDGHDTHDSGASQGEEGPSVGTVVTVSIRDDGDADTSHAPASTGVGGDDGDDDGDAEVLREAYELLVEWQRETGTFDHSLDAAVAEVRRRREEGEP